MRVALVHDYLNQYGGAERVLEAFCEIWPDAPIYTLVYDKEKTGGAFEGRRITTSFLRKIPFVRSHHRPFLILMPMAIEQFELSKYDVVLSDSASFAKGVITRPNTFHICYCHTPTRYLWDDSHKYIREFGYPGFIKKIIPIFMSYLRLWDESASWRPDKFIANSECVRGRIGKYYGQSAEVINPPVKTDIFYIAQKTENYFLAVGRLLSYKRFDLIIAAFNRLGWPLKIIGSGPEFGRLKETVGPNIEFLGQVPDSSLCDYYAHCQALIFPQEEDFGIVAAEAMASGRPVIAYSAGGALEIVKDGETGILFGEQTIDALVGALMRFKGAEFSPQKIREYALSFDKEIFKEKIREFVDKSWEEYNN